jgi:hypothetical protein
MIDTVTRWIKDVTALALVVIALGVVLQILFPNALVFINANVTGNLINLIQQFSGAGLVGLIAAGIIVSLLRQR